MAKWVGIRTKEVRSTLTDQAALPSVDETKERIAEDMGAHLLVLQSHAEINAGKSHAGSLAASN